MNDSDAPSSARSRGWNLAPQRISWLGDADLGARATVRVSVAADHPSFSALERAVREGDPDAAHAVVRSIPMPHAMLDALASSCVAAARARSTELATGLGAPDLRWSRALSRALGAHARPSTASPRSAPLPVLFEPEQGLSANGLVTIDDPAGATTVVRAVNTNYNAPSSRATLTFIDDRRRARATARFEAEARTHFALPLDLDGPQREAVLVEHATDGSAIVRCFRADGSQHEVRRALAPSPAQHYTRRGDALWLHCERHLALAALDEAPTLVFERRDVWPRPIVVHGRALCFSPAYFDNDQRCYVSREASWVDLDDGSLLSSTPWNMEVRDCRALDGVAYVSTNRGVFALDPGSAARQILSSHNALGLAARAHELAIAAGNEAHLFNTLTGATQSSTLGIFASKATLTEGCAAFASFTDVVVLDRGRSVVYESGARREPSVIEGRGGVTLVSAGEVVTAFDEAGTVIASSAAPYDGQLVGATDRVWIFGPISGGVAMTQPTELVAFDERAQRVDGVLFDATIPARRPDRSRYGGGTSADYGAIQRERVLLVDGSGSVRSWSPRAAEAARTFASAPRRATIRGQSIVQGSRSNPRDDWPEPAIDVAGASLLAVDCTLRGTTGAVHERALIVRDGAIVTLVRCDIAGDGGGATIKQGSTLVLVDCVFDRASITVEAGSHLLVASSEDR